jgi:hypothetical protein
MLLQSPDPVLETGKRATFTGGGGELKPPELLALARLEPT